MNTEVLGAEAATEVARLGDNLLAEVPKFPTSNSQQFLFSKFGGTPLLTGVITEDDSLSVG